MIRNIHLRHITPLTIESIRSWEFVGNAHFDGPAFSDIDKFASSSANSVKDRAEALRIMGQKGMGLSASESGAELPDSELVDLFMSSR